MNFHSRTYSHQYWGHALEQAYQKYWTFSLEHTCIIFWDYILEHDSQGHLAHDTEQI